jgi:hypothetical protein
MFSQVSEALGHFDVHHSVLQVRYDWPSHDKEFEELIFMPSAQNLLKTQLSETYLVN